MIDINEPDFRRLDLNLLLVFTALLRERSVTRAAQRLYLGQPAVSAALSRLRAFTGDELFVRTPSGMAPTARALALAEAVKPALESLSLALFAPAGFDPASSTRCFTLGMFDIGEVTLAPALLARMEQAGQGMRLALKPADRNNSAQLLESGAIDLALADFAAVPSWLRSVPLYSEQFACIFDPRLVPAALPISLEDYLAYPHLLTSFSGGFSGFVDEVLAKQGRSRRVVMATSRFTTLPFVLGAFPSLATLPLRAARVYAARLQLAISPLPFALPDVDLSLAWHARHENDAGHAWFRELVASVITGSQER
ncbi:LysR family transcriptional regulator [Pseudoduganella aquatica]|uniref:LysR family transcriptional regulator n=1 Tax=Pseudoduganella aquatica TaxID=2660641 RepID=A0A7X4HGL4_9BURK|nr:LysR family transcriptional regulator [Pseudoduganella aquatica]MYN10896.1 LysR family transcriptional regulator [Pseudoduganella aquatica]